MGGEAVTGMRGLPPGCPSRAPRRRCRVADRTPGAVGNSRSAARPAGHGRDASRAGTVFEPVVGGQDAGWSAGLCGDELHRCFDHVEGRGSRWASAGAADGAHSWSHNRVAVAENSASMP